MSQMKVDCICIVCKKSFNARKNSRFCTATCRQRHRRGVTNVKIPSNVTDKGISVTSLSPQDLYLAIKSYPADTWKDSVEFKELKRRLTSMTVEELTKQDYFVPLWKANNQVPPWKP